MEIISSASTGSAFNFSGPSLWRPELSAQILTWICRRHALLTTEQNGLSGLMKLPPARIAFDPPRSKQIVQRQRIQNDEVAALWRRWRAAAESASAEAEKFRRRIIEFCMPLVSSIAKRYGRWSGGLAVADLEQEGFLGLHAALGSFNPQRGCSFRTYARRRIAGAILDAIRRWRRGAVLSPANKSEQLISRRQSSEAMPQFDSSAELLYAVGSGLSRRQRLIVRLCALDEMSFGDAGKLIGLHASRVGQIYRRSLEMIRVNRRLESILI